MMKSLQVQEGGSHYKDRAIQPIQYMLANDLPYIEGAVVKYVTRWRTKGGIEDLRKARHLLDILIEHTEYQDTLCVDEGCPHHGRPHVCISREATETAAVSSGNVFADIGLPDADKLLAEADHRIDRMALETPPAASSGSAVLDAFSARLPAPAPSEAIPQPDPAFAGLPPNWRPRGLAVPASRTLENADGMIAARIYRGQEILVNYEGAWVWLSVVDTEYKNEKGPRYGAVFPGNKLKVAWVHKKDVFAVRKMCKTYGGSLNNIWEVPNV